MALFGRNRVPKVEGDLGYFKLGDWWLGEFTQAERDSIDTCYQPFGDMREPRLTQGAGKQLERPDRAV